MSMDEDATTTLETAVRLRRVATMLALSSVLTLAGCDQAKQSTDAGPGATPQPSLQSSPQQARPSQPSSADTLMSQAQQDVQFFLDQRADQQSGSQASDNSQQDQSAQKPNFYGDRTTHTQLSPNDPGDAQQPATTTGRSAGASAHVPVRWSDPVGALPAGQTRPQRQPVQPPSTRRSAPADQQEQAPPIVQKPLYRDETKPRDETTPPNANGNSGGTDNSTRSSNQSANDVRSPNRLSQLIVDLSGELYRDAERSDTPLRELMLIAATSLVSPDRKLHAQGIPGLSERDRELLADMQQFFAELGAQLDQSDDNDRVLRAAVEQLKTTLDRTPPFAIAATTLCTRVRGFGDYDEFDKLRFLAHSRQRVIVYIEVENFTSELNDKNDWVTELAQELVIYSDRDGIPVWSETWQSVVDVTRNKRQDFFTVQLVTLPKALSVGRYSLKVRMRDEHTGAVAEHSIPFEMVADPRLAATVR